MNSSSTLLHNTNHKDVNINFNFATNIIIGGSWRGTSVVGLGFFASKCWDVVRICKWYVVISMNPS